MEGYNFVEGTCSPRNILRSSTQPPDTATPKNGSRIRTDEATWSRFFDELRRFPEAFRAVEGFLCSLHPDLEPAVT